MSLPTRTGNPYGPWWEHNLVVFDVETTGLDETEDRVIEVGFARFEKGVLIEQWGSLIFPDREIPEEASEIHGITTAQVASAPRFHATITHALRLTRNAWPVAYNAGFDRKFWAMELARMAMGDLTTPMFDPEVEWLDPVVWFRQMDGVWAGNKLTKVCERHGIGLENAHRATDDATAAGRLIFEVLRDRLPSVTMTELLRRQMHYDAKHDAERRAWFKKKGIAYR